MQDDFSREAEKFRSAVAAALHDHWKLFLTQGLVMMALGLIAVALPQLATLATEIFVGWLFLISGLFRTLTVLSARSAPNYWMSLATALIAMAVGLILVFKPFEGVMTLTIILILVFAVEGVAAIIAALGLRPHLANWGWMLLSGLVNLVLAYLIWSGWPGTALWAIGLLVGINIFIIGLSLALTALGARKAGPS